MENNFDDILQKFSDTSNPVKAKKLLIIIAALVVAFISTSIFVIYALSTKFNTRSQITNQIHENINTQDSKYKLVGKITDQPRQKYVLNFNGIAGAKPIYEYISREREQNSEQIFKESAAARIFDRDKALFYFDSGSHSFIKINKNSKRIETITIPNLNNENPYEFEAYAFNKEWLAINIESPSGTRLILFNTESSETIDTREYSECSIYCLGPKVIKELNKDDFLIIHGGGDGCAAVGEISKYQARDNKKTILMRYGSGCADDADDFLGIYENSLIHADHHYDQLLNMSRYLTVSIMNIDSGESATLIGKYDMPKDIFDIQINKEKGLMALKDKDGNIKSVFDLKTNKFTNEKFDTNTPYESYYMSWEKSFEDLLTDNPDYLNYEIVKEPIYPLRDAYYALKEDPKPQILRIMTKQEETIDLINTTDLAKFVPIDETLPDNRYFAFVPSHQPKMISDKEVEFFFTINNTALIFRGIINLETTEVRLDEDWIP